MRVVKLLAGAACAVRAWDDLDNDLDTTFVRMLTGNQSNATTVAPTTTLAPNATTLPPTTTVDPNATTTLAPTTTVDANATTLPPTTTVDPNATTLPPTTTLAPTTTTAGGGGDSNATTTTATPTTTTAGGGTGEQDTTTTVGGGTGEQDTGAQETTTTIAPPQNNGSNETSTLTFTSSASIAPPFTPPTAAPSRRLRRLDLSLNTAYNLFCSAFSATNSLAACKALQASGKIPADDATDANAQWQAGSVVFPTITACNVDMDSRKANTWCVDTSTDGHCIDNNPQKGMANHEACTVHEAPAGGAAEYKYTTKTTLTALASSVADVTPSVVESAIKTKVESSESKEALKAYFVVAAVKISQDPEAKKVVDSGALNMTQAFGLSDADLVAASNAITNGGGVDAVVQSAYAGTPSDAFAAVAAKTDAATGVSSITIAGSSSGGGSTSDATKVAGVMSSMMIVLLGLFM